MDDDVEFLEDTALRGPGIFRIRVPAVITDFTQKCVGRKHKFTGPPTSSSVVLGINGGDSTWGVEIKSNGTKVSFYLHFQSETKVYLELTAAIHAVDWTGATSEFAYQFLTDFGTFSDKESSALTRKELFVGSGTVDQITQGENSCLVDGNLNVCAEVLFRIDPAIDLNSYEKPNELINAMKAGLQNPAYSDFALISSDGHEIKTHKIVLGSVSPVFRAMFETDCQERRDGFCRVEDADAESIQALLHCVFGGHDFGIPYAHRDYLATRMRVAQNVFKLADKYEIPFVRRKCLIELGSNLKLNNVIELLLLADKHSVRELKNEAFIHLEDHLADALNENVILKLNDTSRTLNLPLYEEFLTHMHLRRTAEARVTGLGLSRSLLI